MAFSLVSHITTCSDIVFMPSIIDVSKKYIAPQPMILVVIDHIDTSNSTFDCILVSHSDPLARIQKLYADKNTPPPYCTIHKFISIIIFVDFFTRNLQWPHWPLYALVFYWFSVYFWTHWSTHRRQMGIINCSQLVIMQSAWLPV